MRRSIMLHYIGAHPSQHALAIVGDIPLLVGERAS